MKPGRSIRVRLLLGAALVLVAFLAGVGLAVQRAHADSSRAERFARLQGTVYLLLAGAELDAQGALVMPASFPEPRLSLPASGLYARIANLARGETWRSPSSVGLDLPFQPVGEVGQWHYGTVAAAGRTFLAASYRVTWETRSQPVPLVLSVASTMK